MPSSAWKTDVCRSEEHTSELQSLTNLVCRLLLEKKKKPRINRRRIATCRGARARACTVESCDRCWQPSLRVGARVHVSPAFSSCFFFFLMKRGPPEFSPFPLPDPLPI